MSSHEPRGDKPTHGDRAQVRKQDRKHPELHTSGNLTARIRHIAQDRKDRKGPFHTYRAVVPGFHVSMRVDHQLQHAPEVGRA